jgi:hypothetical protein
MIVYYYYDLIMDFKQWVVIHVILFLRGNNASSWCALSKYNSNEADMDVVKRIVFMFPFLAALIYNYEL